MSAPDSNLADTRQLLTSILAEAQELKAAAGGSVTDAVAAWLAPQYLLSVREELAANAGAGRFEVLRTFLHDWALLRRGDHSAARLQLDREELDWLRSNSQSQKEKDFRVLIQRPEIRKEIFPEPARGISPETLRKIEGELRLL